MKKIINHIITEVSKSRLLFPVGLLIPFLIQGYGQR